MKRIRNIFKLVAIFAFIISLGSYYEAQASNLEKKSTFKFGKESNYEPNGPYLMINITGVDKQGNDVLYPSYTEINITPGTILTKEDIENYVNWTLDTAEYGKYHVVKLDSNAKIEVSYYNSDKNKYETRSFPITDKGFVIPDLSKYTKNPGFNLITNVVIEEKQSK